MEFLVGHIDEFEENKPARRRIGNVDIAVIRSGTNITIIKAECSHRGGPLNEGIVVENCIVCPWHGSVFSLTSGKVLSGPACNKIKIFETLLIDDHVYLVLDINSLNRGIAKTHTEKVINIRTLSKLSYH